MFKFNRKTQLLVLSLVMFAGPSVISTEGLGVTAQAQQSAKTVLVTGTVVDETAQPAPGATVMVKGNPSLGGAITDEKGQFKFQVPKGAVLTVSYIGYQTFEKTITDAADLMVTLAPDSEMLEDVVVVGYGIQKKESVVGSISQVKSDQLVNSGTTNITNALVGKVSGMLAYSANGSGAPGEDDASFLIRGLSSWNGSAPLVMVDGVERGMQDVSPNDVASISVLKDASATAIYGAKGANGVILVTTKTGSLGRPKFTASANYGIDTALRGYDHIDAVTTATMANIAYKNQGSFGSMYSQAEIQKFADQSEPYRYPDVYWLGEIMGKMASRYNADMSITGGTEKLKYYIGGTFSHQGSILKDTDITSKSGLADDVFNYRLNLDYNLTKTTTVSVKLGGKLEHQRGYGDGYNSGRIFALAYQAPTIVYPAFYGEDALEQYPDPNYPDATWRVANNQGTKYPNPYSYLVDPNYKVTQNSSVFSDLVVNQKLDFITEGLSASAKVSMTSSFSNVKEKAFKEFTRWNIIWSQVDAGVDNPWETSNVSNYVWNEKPFSVSNSNSPSGVLFRFYLEGALNYSRSFAKKHNVTALALYSQTQRNSAAAFAHRNQSFVGRVTYNYKEKYMFEGNVGITGSEQFAPDYRYGTFPSLAVGYYISKENWWKRAMPWWSTMKVRYSHGMVGTDNSTADWLYYTAWETASTDGITYYKEGKVANEGARWETAVKQDLGLEMAWMDDALSLNLDFFKEDRDDILLDPITTAFLGVNYKQVNGGSIKKHGFEVELKYRNTTSGGFYYEAGAMYGWSENRITKYADALYTPAYQKYEGTTIGAARAGTNLVDDKYFSDIDDIHIYPTYATTWLGNVNPGSLKFLDYKVDGIIQQNDAHVVKGNTYAPGMYTFSLAAAYKGFSFSTMFTGTIGKYIEYKRSCTIPFLQGTMVVHKTQVDYWRPDNHLAESASPTFTDSMWSWAGGTADHPGYDMQLPGYTWRTSDWASLKEVRLAYKFQTEKLRKSAGIDGLEVSLTGNNLFTLTNLPELEPYANNVTSMYYPQMRTIKLGARISF